jgi:hypothetical protein
VKWFQPMPREVNDFLHLGQLKLKALPADQKNAIPKGTTIQDALVPVSLATK